VRLLLSYADVRQDPHRTSSRIRVGDTAAKRPSVRDRPAEADLSIRAVPFNRSGGEGGRTLTDRQRAVMLSIATRLQLPARTILYRESGPMDAVYVVAEGIVKSFRDLPSGKRRIAAFLFPSDLFGLAENGRYVNTAQAITRVTVYRLPSDQLAHELRESQRRAILITRRDAPGRLAMFLRGVGRHLADVDEPDVIALPMSRSEIAEFLALSLETVSRATVALEKRGLVAFEGRHSVRILDPIRLGKLAAKV
jgi:CRP-like cAMP-binding protein